MIQVSENEISETKMIPKRLMIMMSSTPTSTGCLMMIHKYIIVKKKNLSPFFWKFNFDFQQKMLIISFFLNMCVNVGPIIF